MVIRVMLSYKMRPRGRLRRTPTLTKSEPSIEIDTTRLNHSTSQLNSIVTEDLTGQMAEVTLLYMTLPMVLIH